MTGRIPSMRSGGNSMPKASSLGPRVAWLLATLAVVAVVAAQHSAVTASADNPTLTGDLCTFNGSMICMTMTWNGVAYGTPNRADLAVKPGTYTLTVNDTSAAHDFALRSCQGSTSRCDGTNPLGTVNAITTPAQTGTVSSTVVLAPGTYRLYCTVPTHETRGMFVDFRVEASPVATNS